MQVTVRLFAMLRERAGSSEVTLELREGARVRDAVAALGALADGLPLVMAVNREYAPEDQELDPGDELALIPPVSGGEAAAAITTARSPTVSTPTRCSTATRVPGSSASISSHSRVISRSAIVP